MTESSQPPANSPRILCVEDEPVLRDLLTVYLQRADYNVAVAPDGLAALQLISEDPSRFDLVITDNQMPRMEGIELVEKLRAIGFPGRIIFFSSTLAPQSAERLTRLRVHAVVEKGQPVSILLAAVRDAMQTP